MGRRVCVCVCVRVCTHVQDRPWCIGLVANMCRASPCPASVPISKFKFEWTLPAHVRQTVPLCCHKRIRLKSPRRGKRDH